jgi:hypothetical protein
MAALTWDTVGNHRYETGVDKAVLFVPDTNGNYINAYSWNGLTKVTEKPVGGTTTPLYANNSRYLNLISAEFFGADIAAYTYPDAWAVCDGSVQPESGVSVGQQNRQTFGFCYRTHVGNELVGTDLGYKLHLVWGCTAAPSQKAWATINDNPTANEMTWAVTCVPVAAAGYKPLSTLVIDSTKVNASALATLQDTLYGTSGVNGRLPMPDEVLAMFTGTMNSAVPTAPTYNGTTHVVTIPVITGLQYYKVVAGVATPVVGTVTIAVNTVFMALPTAGYYIPDPNVNEWLVTY